MSDMIDAKDESTNVASSEHTMEVMSVEVPAYTQKQTFGQLLRGDLGFIPVLLTLVAIVIFFTVISNGVFLSPRNISNLFLQTADYGVLGLGVIMVLLLGEIDLSIASVSTFCAVVMAVLSERLGASAGVAIVAAILAGALIGAINGFFVAVLRIPSFIVTLAASIAYSGLLLTLLNGQSTLIIRSDFIVGLAGTPYSFLPDLYGVLLPGLALVIYLGAEILNYMQRRRIGLRVPSLPSFAGRLALVSVIVVGAVIVFESYFGVPYSTAILFGLILLFWLILTKTPFGRHVYAVGGNAEAARRAAINVVGIRVIIFTLCSTLAAVGGILEASRGTAVASQIPPSLLLDSIAAAVIGGVSLFGGSGSVWAIVLGMLIIGSLENGLSLKSQGADVKQIIEGSVLLIAVTVDALVRRVQARSKSGK